MSKLSDKVKEQATEIRRLQAELKLTKVILEIVQKSERAMADENRRLHDLFDEDHDIIFELEHDE